MITDTDKSEHSTPSRLARAPFTSGLAILTIRNLTDLDGRIVYAETKSAPEADRFVPAATDLLLGGSLDVGFWRLPQLASASITAFSAGVTPTVHDLWAVDDGARDEEFMLFLQNLTLFDATLALLKHTSDE